MIFRAKTLTTLTALTAFSLSLACDARAEFPRVEKLTDVQVQACVAELRKHADYTDASRVVHRIDKLDQKNLIELEISFSSSVYLTNARVAARNYRTSCTTDSLGDVLELRVSRTAANADLRG